MVIALKLPRRLCAAAFAFIVSCVGTMRFEGAVQRIAAPDLSEPLVETYPPPAQPRDRIKAAVFARINRHRVSEGLRAVAWDEAAARVADAFCAQQVREQTQGHYLMDGLPPYARTGFAGIFGDGAENSASAMTTGVWAEESFEELASNGHDRMMQERPPHDGHRRTILDPEATHVGVGYFGRGGQFRMAQEFTTRRLERLALQRAGSRLLAISVEGRVLAPDHILFVTIAREPMPVRLTKEQANSHTSYSYPEPAEAFVPEGYRGMRVIGAATQDHLRLRRDREFAFTYGPDSPGLYTFVFYVAPREGEKPRPGGSATVLVE